MNAISKEQRRLLFAKEVESKLGLFCQLATEHHPQRPSCYPFKPAGHDRCVKYGSFNLCVFVHFDTNDKWVIRVPFTDRNPWVLERLRSEIATMTYVAARTTIPVPILHAYSLKSDNHIQSPFLIMNYVEGRPPRELGFQRGGATPVQVVQKVYQQLASVYLELRQLEFPVIGALSLPTNSGRPPTGSEIAEITVQSRPLSMNMAMQHAEGYQPEDIIQPGTTFSTTGDFVTALEKLAKNQLQKSPDIGLDCRAGRSLLYANDAIFRFAEKAWLTCKNGPFVLTHGDITLHDNNILLDPDFNLVAVIDWEWSYVAPVQFLVPPVWLTGSGFGFMLEEPKWYSREHGKFLRQVKHLEDTMQTKLTLSSVWTGIVDTATAAALLHPDNIYESYWGIIFWEQCGVDNADPKFDRENFSRNSLMPLLERFMDSEENRALLGRKYSDQIKFFEDEKVRMKLDKRGQLYDGDAVVSQYYQPGLPQ